MRILINIPYGKHAPAWFARKCHEISLEAYYNLESFHYIYICTYIQKYEKASNILKMFSLLLACCVDYI